MTPWHLPPHSVILLPPTDTLSRLDSQKGLVMVVRVGESNISRGVSHAFGSTSFPNHEIDTNSFVGDIWRHEYVVVDLETTGLGADSQMTEIGAVRL